MTGLPRGGGPSAAGASPLDPVALQQAGRACLAAAVLGLAVVVVMTLTEMRRRAAEGKDLGFPVPWIVAALPLLMVAAAVVFLVAPRASR